MQNVATDVPIELKGWHLRTCLIDDDRIKVCETPKTEVDVGSISSSLPTSKVELRIRLAYP